MDLTTGEKNDFSEGFDQNAEGLKWGDDNTIWFISDWPATDEIYSLDIPTRCVYETGLPCKVYFTPRPWATS